MRKRNTGCRHREKYHILTSLLGISLERIKEGTELGRKQRIYGSRIAVPDELVVAIVEERLKNRIAEMDFARWISRTVEQANHWIKCLLRGCCIGQRYQY